MFALCYLFHGEVKYIYSNKFDHINCSIDIPRAILTETPCVGVALQLKEVVHAKQIVPVNLPSASKDNLSALICLNGFVRISPHSLEHIAVILQCTVVLVISFTYCQFTAKKPLSTR